MVIKERPAAHLDYLHALSEDRVTLRFCMNSSENRLESNYQSGNKRIAKNTLVVYGQLAIRVLLGLYTSRLALEALGVSDFGLYSVVGGIVALFTVISSSLGGTTVRYINVERGKPDGDLNRVFNVCHVLHIAMAVFLFLLLEVGGIYYIHHYLNAEAGKEGTAMFAFQVATIVCCLGIFNVPFSSLFNAAEKFLFTAVVAISVKAVQLILLYWLLTYDGNRIGAFAIIEGLTTLASFVIYHYYCYRRWPDIVRWRFIKEWGLSKEILIFSYYNLLTSIAYMGRNQGSMLLINFFFGTVVNGAFAVGKTIERNISPFARNIQNAAAPQMTQSYSGGDMERVYYLTNRICKYCILMMMLAFFPLWAELDFILHLWLIKVPEGALVFCQIILLMVFVSVTDGGLTHVANASGKISKFKMTYSIVTLACIPVGFIILKAGYPAYSLLIVFLIADIFWRISQIYLMHRILHFPVLRFCRESYLPPLIASIPIILCMILTSQIQTDSRLWHLCHLAFILLLTVFSIYYLGLQKNERKKVTNHIKTKILKQS